MRVCVCVSGFDNELLHLITGMSLIGLKSIHLACLMTQYLCLHAPRDVVPSAIFFFIPAGFTFLAADDPLKQELIHANTGTYIVAQLLDGFSQVFLCFRVLPCLFFDNLRQHTIFGEKQKRGFKIALC